MVARYCPNSSKSRACHPFRYTETGPPRSVGRRALLRALASEYEHGNSVSKLYVALLARAVVEQEPRLLRPPADPRFRWTPRIRNFLECGVRVQVPDAAVRKTPTHLKQ
jgi:ribosomal protein S30